MRYLKEFNEYEPKTDKVSEYKDLLDRKYNISEYQDDKFVIIDDKSYYLTGTFFNKGFLTKKIFNDVIHQITDVHEPSLRKAIKNWIDGINSSFTK